MTPADEVINPPSGPIDPPLSQVPPSVLSPLVLLNLTEERDNPPIAPPTTNDTITSMISTDTQIPDTTKRPGIPVGNAEECVSNVVAGFSHLSYCRQGVEIPSNDVAPLI